MRGMTLLQRDVEATLIPSGERVRVPAGTDVWVRQALGGNYTVESATTGQLLRIDERDAGALGEEYAPEQKTPEELAAEEAAFSEERVWEQLRTVYDPEIPVNIVELGLVYALQSEPLPEGGHKVGVKMTLTAPGCGMGPVLVEDVRRKVSSVPGVRQADVELVWEPPWDQSRMSDVARLQLGWM